MYIAVSFTMVIESLLAENLQAAGAQLRNPPGSSGVNSDLRELASVQLSQ